MTTRASRPANAARLPAGPLLRSFFIASAVAWFAAASGALGFHVAFDTDARQPILAVVVFSAMLLIAFVALRDSHPFPRFGAANRVTLLRAVLVSLVASLLAAPAVPLVAWTVVILTVIVTALDGVDGWLARRTRMSSAFGARFDMETDAFLMLVLSAVVWQHEKAGAWVMGIGLMRYTFVAAGRLLPWLARPLRSTLRGKTMAIVTLVALGASVAPVVPAWLSTIVCAAALGGLTWSFAVDVRFLYRAR